MFEAIAWPHLNPLAHQFPGQIEKKARHEFEPILEGSEAARDLQNAQEMNPEYWMMSELTCFEVHSIFFLEAFFQKHTLHNDGTPWQIKPFHLKRELLKTEFEISKNKSLENAHYKGPSLNETTQIPLGSEKESPKLPWGLIQKRPV